MHFRICDIDIELTFGFFAALAVFMLFDRSGLLLWMLLTILLHETGHLCAMLLCGSIPRAVVLEPFGVKIVEGRRALSYLQDALVLFAGPAANLLLFLVLYLLYGLRMPIVGVISLLTGALNLLPIGLLDGGRMVENLLQLFLPYRRAQTVSDVVSFLCLVPLFVLGIVILCSAGHNFTLLLLCTYLLVTIVFKTNMRGG